MFDAFNPEQQEAADWEELEEVADLKNRVMTDVFMKVDGIDGESLDDKHKNEIEILAWKSGVQQQSSAQTGGGMGTGKSHHHDFKIIKLVDKSTPKLHLACCNGEHIKKVVLTLRKAGKDQQEFLKITLSDVMITAHRHVEEDDPVSGLPRDGIAMAYSKIEFEYKEQKPDGTLGGAIKAGWDVKARKAV